MSLRDRIRSSRQKRARDLTVEGIGDFKLLIPSVARATYLLKEMDKDRDREGNIRFKAEIIAEHMVDENFERAYTDEEIPDLIKDLDPYALEKIYRAIISPADPDAVEKNSESTPKGSSPTA